MTCQHENSGCAIAQSWALKLRGRGQTVSSQIIKLIVTSVYTVYPTEGPALLPHQPFLPTAAHQPRDSMTRVAQKPTHSSLTYFTLWLRASAAWFGNNGQPALQPRGYSASNPKNSIALASITLPATLEYHDPDPSKRNPPKLQPTPKAVTVNRKRYSVLQHPSAKDHPQRCWESDST